MPAKAKAPARPATPTGGWNPYTVPIDYVLAQGQPSPGLAEVRGTGDLRAWDERRGYGLSGSFAVFTGKKLARWTIRLRLFTPADWAGWVKWYKLIAKVPTTRFPKAIEVWHPQLEMRGIRAMQIEEIPLEEQDEAGLWTVTIKCLEFRKPKMAYAKPDAAQATKADPYDQRIQQLTAQVQKLASGGRR